MARTTIEINVPPETVFDVLADPQSYSYWVVGSKVIHSADENWPEVGSSFRHSVGIGRLKISDRTTVTEMCRPELIVLLARARPLGTATVTLTLRPAGSGTEVTMIEDPGDARTQRMFNWLTHALVRGRNRWSLDRLCKLAEGEIAIPVAEIGRTAELPGGAPLAPAAGSSNQPRR